MLNLYPLYEAKVPWVLPPWNRIISQRFSNFYDICFIVQILPLNKKALFIQPSTLCLAILSARNHLFSHLDKQSFREKLA